MWSYFTILSDWGKCTIFIKISFWKSFHSDVVNVCFPGKFVFTQHLHNGIDRCVLYYGYTGNALHFEDSLSHRSSLTVLYEAIASSDVIIPRRKERCWHSIWLYYYTASSKTEEPLSQEKIKQISLRRCFSVLCDPEQLKNTYHFTSWLRTRSSPQGMTLVSFKILFGAISKMFLRGYTSINEEKEFALELNYIFCLLSSASNSVDPTIINCNFDWFKCMR